MTATRKQGARNPANLSNFSCKIHSYSGMTRSKNKNEEVPERARRHQTRVDSGYRRATGRSSVPVLTPIGPRHLCNEAYFPSPYSGINQPIHFASTRQHHQYILWHGAQCPWAAAPALIIPNRPTLPSIRHAMHIYIYSQTAHLHLDASPSIAQPTLGDVD
jgi:hypothetical protein